jgi:hypothetical protein
MRCSLTIHKFTCHKYMECSGLVCEFVLDIWKDIEQEVLIYELYCLVSDIVSYKKIDGKG